MAKRHSGNGVAVVEDDPVMSRDAALFRVPLSDPDPATYIARETGHIDMYLRGEALEVFRRIHAGLIDAGAKFANGKPIATKADVVQWLFEQAAA